MTLNFLIAPDFAPQRFAGWHMLNTTLQRRSGLRLHLLTPASRHDVVFTTPAVDTSSGRRSW